MKQHLRRLFEETLMRLSVERVLADQVTCADGILTVGHDTLDMSRYRKLITVAIGKAAIPMLEKFSDIVAPQTLTGVVATLGPVGQSLPGFTVFTGGHPYPNQGSFDAAAAAIDIVGSATSDDLVVFLLSGGGSSLCEMPVSQEITLEDCRVLYQVLVTCGASIRNVNTIRKHLSAIKGGRLAELAFPARQMTLYVSDVPPDTPSSVASGPTMPDDSTAENCRQLIQDLNLRDQLPPSIRYLFDEDLLPETPKPGKATFQESSWHCLLSSANAVETMAHAAERLGWIVETDHELSDAWSVDQLMDHMITKLEHLQRQHADQTVAVLSGGEYSCPVTGDGIGGRNQAFVLECVPRIAGRRVAVLSAGTDGLDGSSPAAGAVADGESLNRARQIRLDPETYATQADSHRFFAQLDDAIMTGPTGNNVRDLRMFVAW